MWGRREKGGREDRKTEEEDVSYCRGVKIFGGEGFWLEVKTRIVVELRR